MCQQLFTSDQQITRMGGEILKMGKRKKPNSFCLSLSCELIKTGVNKHIPK